MFDGVSWSIAVAVALVILGIVAMLLFKKPLTALDRSTPVHSRDGSGSKGLGSGADRRSGSGARLASSLSAAARTKAMRLAVSTMSIGGRSGEPPIAISVLLSID